MKEVAINRTAFRDKMWRQANFKYHVRLAIDKEVRLMTGMTQEEVNRLFIEAKTSEENAARLAKVFRIPYDELVEGEDS